MDEFLGGMVLYLQDMSLHATVFRQWNNDVTKPPSPPQKKIFQLFALMHDVIPRLERLLLGAKIVTALVRGVIFNEDCT